MRSQTYLSYNFIICLFMCVVGLLGRSCGSRDSERYPKEGTLVPNDESKPRLNSRDFMCKVKHGASNEPSGSSRGR